MRLWLSFAMIIALLGCIGAGAEEKLVNIAKLEGVSYNVSAGSHWADHNKDPHNVRLTDGVYDSGRQYAVCYDFYRQPEEERYVSVDFNLRKSYDLRKIVLWAKNHNQNWNVSSVRFYVSSDGLDYEEVGVVPEEGSEIAQPTTGVFKVEQELNKRARFVRVLAYTRYYINLEEIEIFAIEE